MSVDATAAEAERAAALRRGKVGVGLIAAYGSGTLADSVTQTALNFFLFFYLTAVCGMSNSLAGLSGLVALCVDAMADPLVGALSDNSWSRLGRRHPFMFAGVGPLALGLGLLFSLPSGLSPLSLFAYATGVSILLRVSHSTFFLPYIGLGRSCPTTMPSARMWSPRAFCSAWSARRPACCWASRYSCAGRAG